MIAATSAPRRPIRSGRGSSRVKAASTARSAQGRLPARRSGLEVFDRGQAAAVVVAGRLEAELGEDAGDVPLHDPGRDRELAGDAGSRLVRLRVSDARTGLSVRGCEQLVQLVALRLLVAPDVRCAEKKVR
jgi:hypothetical protein